ncbi:MAG: DNA mismatch repair endonuclease MutL [Acidobacteria bacterium]|nr:DNA mismatch repair endonuclease MutL [Acidobacteriota bacterium]
MGRIKVLTPEVADRIAAGEVVERPASVVRELLDNSLDAGAGRIDIELEAGGCELVAVADDGCGVDRDDALLAFERHATSKIRTGDDLDSVATLGFRGEALAAIAAVSRVELVSSAGGEATRVLMDRGRLVTVEPASRARGTSISVRGLFHGIPARRKFLKSSPTELDHALRAAQRAALGWPEVGFRLGHGGRVLLEAPGPVPPRARIADVLGARWARDLLETEADGGRARIFGWVARADQHRTDRLGLHLFVNRRPVRDPLLLRAVADAGRGIIPAGRFPVVVLFLEVLPADVDVNAHPAKAEVRFHHPQEIRALVTGALGRAWASRAAAPLVGVPAAGPPARPTFAPAPHPQAARFEFAVREPGAFPPPAPAAAAATTAAPPADGSPRALAQFRDCYIVAADERGLLVVDQHVAHERLLFEQLIADADAGPLPRQALLFPEPLDAGPAELDSLERHRQALERIGFRYEPFGGTAVIVREVPAILGRGAGPGSLLAVVAELEATGKAGSEALFRQLLATLACHAAVRKGMPLGRDQMQYILRGLAGCELPTHCPHGRVIALRVDLAALERGVDRA